MAEFPKPDHLIPGHVFDPSSARRDLWLLLTIVIADKAIAEETADEFFEDGFNQPVLGLVGQFVEDEITRTLVNSAIVLRIMDDRDGGFLENFPTCGSLQENLSNDRQLPLTLREACNKIVHATKINFDLERLDGQPLTNNQPTSPTFLRPYIYLYGEKQGANWRAILNLVDFVRAAAQAL